MTASLPTTIDVVPFSAWREWVTPQDYEIWWEDPRDIYWVVVHLAPGIELDPSAVRLEYWQRAWPKVRVEKSAVVGAGESGWLAADDWTNGRWQIADCDFKQDGTICIWSFLPLNRMEFPEEVKFPALFRHTLKLALRFPSEGVEIKEIFAYSDSEWREKDVLIEWKSTSGKPMQWDGRLEAFNGHVLQARPVTPGVARSGENQWQSTVQGAETGGIRATIRYAHNEDCNSFDRTIVTLRTAVLGNSLTGLSFTLEPLLAGESIYVRDLGVLIRSTDQALDFPSFEKAWENNHQPTLYQQIAELPEHTWEESWAHMTRKKSRMYYTLGCEGSRQKFGFEPNGDVFFTENYIRQAPGKDTPRLSLERHREVWEKSELRLSFGFPSIEPGDRFILDNYLPIVHTAWVEDGVCFEQEAYARWLMGEMRIEERMPGDDPVVAMMQVRFTNLTNSPKTVTLRMKSTADKCHQEQLSARQDLVYAEGDRLRFLFDAQGKGQIGSRDGDVLFTLDLAPHLEHTIVVKIPHILLSDEEIERLRGLNYSSGKEQVADYWRQRINQGAQILTPNETINNFYRTALMHSLVINDREPGTDCNVARCGGFHYGSFPDEGCMVINDLDRRGYTREAENCLQLYINHQGEVGLPGNFQSTAGVFYGSGGYEVAGYNRNHGWVLWSLVEHYRYTHDLDWLKRTAPALVKGCEWIINERQATMKKGTIQYGFLPSGSLEDVTDYWTWLATNAYAYWGFIAAAEVLVEIGHPQADYLLQEARLFGEDLRNGFFEACSRSPVVPLRDGTWVPHFPVRQERRGRDFGWLREVLEGPCHLIYCGIIAPDEPAARWIIEDYEDNLFLSEGYGYHAPDFERQWFYLGGFSMQSNLLLFPPLYLWRDEVKHYLRGYYNSFTSAFFPDTATMCEHALPDLDQWRGDHFKSSDEANSNSWLRLMFLAESNNELFIGQAIPRAWLEHGNRLQVKRAITHFGETSLEMISEVATGYITVKLSLPERNPPEHIHLRVRHPSSQAIRAVWVNGLPYTKFNADKEMIALDGLSGAVEVRVKY